MDSPAGTGLGRLLAAWPGSAPTSSEIDIDIDTDVDTSTFTCIDIVCT